MHKLDMLLNLGERPQTKYFGHVFFLNSLNPSGVDIKFGFLKEDLRMLKPRLSGSLSTWGSGDRVCSQL